jgi:predicted Ser/Thr protein kinase
MRIMGHSEDRHEKQLRKGTRSIVFGVAVLIGLAVYKMAEQIPQLQDFKILFALVIGATVFALLRRVLL